MRPTIRFFAVLAALALAFAACKTPSTDPDEALRDLLVSTTWESDLVNYAAETPGKFMVFYSNGTGEINGAIAMTWTIKNGGLTITTDGTSDVIPAGTFDVTETTLYVEYDGRPYHMVPLGNG